jgi:putative cell wall-binding protein
MLASSAFARPLVVALLLGATLAGCGKSFPSESQSRGAGVTTVAGTGALAASGLATKNTTRLGGADPIADAAAVALAVDPGLTPATRPAAVVLVNAHNWIAALASSALASAPLSAPLLYCEGDTLPAISAQALAALRPRGAASLGGAQVIAIDTAATPGGYRARSLGATAGRGEPDAAGGASPAGASALAASAASAVRIERLVALARGGAPRRVIVVGADGPQALAMPAAGLAAETGAPILVVGARGIPNATRRLLLSLRRPLIYAIGPAAAVSDAVLAKLSRLGTVRRIDASAGVPVAAPGEGSGDETTQPAGAAGAGAEATANAEAVANAIAVARYSDGSFGWDVEEPGHGLVFAALTRPLDAPAAAPLSASGGAGPLLLLQAHAAVPRTLADYLSDIQPSYPEYEPTRGFYNHGWLIGDEAAIAARTQAELDAMLESLPRGSATPTTTTP